MVNLVEIKDYLEKKMKRKLTTPEILHMLNGTGFMDIKDAMENAKLIQQLKNENPSIDKLRKVE